MKHARPDYNCFQDPAGLIPEDEPVFLIRGQDVCAPYTLRKWAKEAGRRGVGKELINMVLDHAHAMELWQLEHGEKIPDLPPILASQVHPLPPATLIQRARQFATDAHHGQVRRFTGEAYIGHPVRVAKLIEAAGFEDTVTAAALLHDVIEDCNVPATTIEAKFGATVRRLVVELTNEKADSMESGDEAVRRQGRDFHRVVSLASPQAQAIKCADIIDNCGNLASVTRNTPGDLKWARTYLNRKLALLSAIVGASPLVDQTLLARAFNAVTRNLLDVRQLLDLPENAE